MLELKIGDPTVLLVTVFPFDSTCDGSYVVFVPFLAVITTFSGIM